MRADLAAPGQQQAFEPLALELGAKATLNWKWRHLEGRASFSAR
jgi:hypothetical protein